MGIDNPDSYVPREKEAGMREKRKALGSSSEVLGFVEEYRDVLKSGDGVLELGVGEGRNLLAFKGLGLKLHGVDLSPMGVEECKKNLKAHDMDAEIKEGSFTDLDGYGEDSMKVLITQYAIQNSRSWEDIEHIFEEAQRILEDEGLFLFREQRFPFKKDSNRDIRIAYFTPEEIQDLSERYGFDIVSGNEPVEVRENLERVGGMQVEWNVVMKKRIA